MGIPHLWNPPHDVLFSPLVNSHSYGKSQFIIGRSTINRPCSIAMLNYQRVMDDLLGDWWCFMVFSWVFMADVFLFESLENGEVSWFMVNHGWIMIWWSSWWIMVNLCWCHRFCDHGWWMVRRHEIVDRFHCDLMVMNHIFRMEIVI